MITALFLILGLVVGSFLNVVIIRHKERGLGGRSGCMSCGVTLTVRDLMPVLSWLSLRGRCRRCGSRISIQYPLVESITGILFAFFGTAIIAQTDLALVGIELGIGWTIIALLVCITVYDMRHTIIPDRWNYLFLVSAILYSLVSSGNVWAGLTMSVIGALACAFPFAMLWWVSSGRWMGLGDAKLALGIGALLGVEQGYMALLVSFWSGALVSVLFLIALPSVLRHLHVRARWVRGYSLKSEIPFGPYLIFGCILVWYLGLYGMPFVIPGLSL